jgi:TonB family protein
VLAAPEMPSDPAPRLTHARTLSFYLRLAVHALLLTLAGPMLNVALGRAAEPKLAVAAFWIAFSLVVPAQSACLVVQQITIVLVARRVATRPLLTLALGSGLVSSGIALVVALTVAASGDVLEATVVQNTVGSSRLAECALSQIRDWKFAAIPEGLTTFQAPFVFTPPS